MRSLARRAERFLFPADTGLWLTLLRVGLSLQLMFYLFSLRADWIELFGRGPHLLNRALNEAVLSGNSYLTPRLGWLIKPADALGLPNVTTLWFIWWLMLAISLLLLLGLASRGAAVAAWFLYLSSAKCGSLFSYGVDNFTIIGLFYLTIAPLPDRWSLDHVWRRKPLAAPDRIGFHRRVLQLHLCVIYLFSGIAKCLGPEWWNGGSLWRALNRPPFDLIPPGMLLRVAWLLPFLGVSAMLLETGYLLFIWHPRTRMLWLPAIICLHLAIGVTMGLYLFSLVMIVLNVAAFGPGFRLFWPLRRTPLRQ